MSKISNALAYGVVAPKNRLRSSSHGYLSGLRAGSFYRILQTMGLFPSIYLTFTGLRARYFFESPRFAACRSFTHFSFNRIGLSVAGSNPGHWNDPYVINPPLSSVSLLGRAIYRRLI